MQVGVTVSRVDDLTETPGVYFFVVDIGRERHRRLIERLTVDYDITARQFLAEAAQPEPRKYDLCAGGADVDADTRQRDMILRPQRVFPARAIVEMIVVVICVFPIMRMRGIDAVCV